MRYVVAVSEERSFTRAAERCHVVQSALSHQIKALERELGLTLFVRSSRRVETTPAGEAFVAAARVSLEAAERAITDATAEVGIVRGTLRIGIIPTVTRLDIPRALGEFTTAYPAVDVRLRHGGSDEFESEIAAGGLDVAVLGLTGAVTSTSVQARLLAEERLALVVGADHRLVARPPAMLADLAEEAFIDFPSGTPGRLQTDGAFEAAGVQRTVRFEMTGVDIMVDLVRHGLGSVFLPPGLVPADDRLRAVEVADGPARHEYLAWSAFNPSPAATAFVSMLERQLE